MLFIKWRLSLHDVEIVGLDYVLEHRSSYVLIGKQLHNLSILIEW